MAAAQARTAVEDRVQGQIQAGTVSSWLVDDALVLVLLGSTAGEAESVLSTLRAAQEPGASSINWGAVSGGITELARGDDSASVFDRARHALWRAKRAGRGTVVVAMAADDPRP